MSYSGFDTPESGARRKSSLGQYSHSDDEMRLLDYLDGKLNAAEAKAVEAHLLACPQCLDFRERWEQLDQELMRMETPGLSPGFERRLWLRISEMPPPRLEADQKQSVEAELRKDWDSIRRGFLRSQAMRLLDYTGFTVAAALGAYLFYAVSAKALASSPDWAASLQQWILQLSSGAGLVILCGALVLVGRKRIGNWIGSV